MPISKRQLAASLLSTLHIEARDMMVGFLQQEATRFLDAPFANTKAAVVRQVWGHTWDGVSSTGYRGRRIVRAPAYPARYPL